MPNHMLQISKSETPLDRWFGGGVVVDAFAIRPSLAGGDSKVFPHIYF